VARAVVAGDAAGAEAAMRAHLVASRDRLRPAAEAYDGTADRADRQGAGTKR
jgi:DNA-binding FadR family transcriptional regulator